MVWVGALTAAAGSAYWYSTTSKGAAERDKAEARAREMQAKGRAKADEGKIKANQLRVGALFFSSTMLYSSWHPLGRGGCEIRGGKGRCIEEV